jgi:beta-lactamase class A
VERISVARKRIQPTRRALWLGVAALATPAWAGDGPFAAIERRHGGRLGVFVLDTGSGRSLAWRADERFLMCSTFKTLVVGRVLSRVEAGRERLERHLSYGDADLLDYAPAARANVARGWLSVGEMCAAAIQVSDNTAANLLMKSFGGPAEVTRYARSLGDSVTRQDRWEPQANLPDGDKDTTSPRAMAHSLRALLLGPALKPASRAMLEAWLTTSTRGLQRIRAGLPQSWRAGAKAGTGQGQTNDVAIIRPPGRAPIIAAAYYRRARAMPEAKAEAVLREVGAVIAG